MELYNFFTIPKEDKADLEARMPELQELCICVNLVEHKTPWSTPVYSIIGQLHGEDTNVGDTDLLVILSGINYVWMDARCPTINNLPKP